MGETRFHAMISRGLETRELTVAVFHVTDRGSTCFANRMSEYEHHVGAAVGLM